MTTPIITPTQFLAELDAQNWHYEYLSGPAYYKGRDNCDRLREIAKSHELLGRVWQAYVDYNFGRRKKPTAEEFEPDNARATRSQIVAQSGTQAANDPHHEPDPEPITMDRDSLLSLVRDGKIFSVTFTKRTTGESRTMQARLGVTRHLSGGQKPYRDRSKNLLTVWSMDADGFRSVPVDTIRALTVRGTRYVAA